MGDLPVLPVPLGPRALVLRRRRTYKRWRVESKPTAVSTTTRLLAVLAVVLFLLALLQFISGNLLIAGVSMLAVSLTIYYRETRL